jgi:hypothetical protein
MLSGAAAQAPTRTNLSFTDAFQLDDRQIKSRDETKPFFFKIHTPDGISYPFTVDVGTQFSVWLDHQVPLGVARANARSLGIRITSDRDADEKDKIFFDVVPWKSAQHIDLNRPDGPRFISFDFMLDKGYELPTAWVIHLQAWQCCGGQPPFIMGVTPRKGDPKGPLELFFGYRDDVSMEDPAHSLRVSYKMPVSRGQWNHMQLALEPSPDNSPRLGVIAMWLNGTKRFEEQTHWAFRPGQIAYDGKDVQNQIGIDIGIYRRRQRTTQVIYFDNVTFSRSSSS